MKNIFSIILVLAAAVVYTGCATKVERVEVDEKIDLSGEWNDYDAMLAAKDIIADCLDNPWLINFVETASRKPVVIVGHVSNQSDEHVNTQVITKYLERELLNSGKIVFVASPEEREGIRDERDDQRLGYTDNQTIAEFGKERGADLMLIGSFHSIKDEVKGKFAVLYQMDLELVSLTTNEKLWIGQKQIKKKVKKAKFSL